MTFYALLIFLHVLAAVGMFAAWGVEAVNFQRLRQAGTLDEARTAAQSLQKQGRMGPVSMSTVLVTGIWMMVTRWGPQPWMMAALAAIVLTVLAGIMLARRAMPRLQAVLTGTQDELPEAFYASAGILAASFQFRVAMGIGILGLMTVKPGTAGALAMVTAAIASGLILIVTRSGRATAIRRERGLASTPAARS